MSERLKYLLNLYLHDRCTAEEWEELTLLALEPDLQEEVRNLLAPGTIDDARDMQPEKAEQLFKNIIRPARIIPIWKRWAVAASIITVLALAGYFLLVTPKSDDVIASQPGKNVNAPDSNHATIQLASGRLIYLDSVANGIVVTQQEAQIIKKGDGQIVYQSATTGADKTAFNTLSNPRGSKVIDMTLSDGSRVWLNAGSSLRYPVIFTDKNREVAVKGEAYFEIFHDAAHPFVVLKGTAKIQVLGTRFNVNAYEDEGDIRVSLLEGSVSVSLPGNQLQIKPGQQAILTNSIVLKTNIDTVAVMAWRNGRFVFENGADIKTIMRQISRWYGVEVTYEGNVYSGIGGSMSRKENLGQVLKLLELTGRVHFIVDGNKITVKP